VTSPSPAEEKRARILRAARQVCARSGLERLRMDEIAAEARVSKGTLYNFFASKKELFLSCILVSYQVDGTDLRRRMREGKTPRQRMELMIEGLLELFPTISGEMLVNLQAWGMAAGEADARDQLFAALCDLYTERGEQMEQLVREGQAAGEFAKDAEPERFARAFTAVFDGFLYRSTFDPERANAQTLGEAFDLLLREHLGVSRVTRGEAEQ
jgi:AcrR family transcriptional regulator